MAHNREFFRRRADEARVAAFRRDGSEDAEIAGNLALAYAALARVRPGEGSVEELIVEPAQPAVAQE